MEKLTIPKGTEVVNLEISLKDYQSFFSRVFKHINKEIKSIYIKGEEPTDPKAKELLKTAKNAYIEYYKYLDSIKD